VVSTLLYCDGIAVTDEKQVWPIEMDWPTFMRPYRIGQTFFNGAGLRESIMRIIPIEVGVELANTNGMRLCRGGYKTENAEQLEESRGPCYVLTMNGVVVGGVDRYALWIEPPFRSKDLAVELYVVMFIALGPEKWLNNRYTARGAPQTYTAAGFESRRRAYLALVQRGYIKTAINVPEDAFEAHKATRTSEG
jgi:hypothetical protein